MSSPSERSPSPEESIGEFKIGEGDPVNVLKIDRITYTEDDGEIEQQGIGEVPNEAVANAREHLSRLPLRFGDKTHIGTTPRPSHDVNLRIARADIEHETTGATTSGNVLYMRFNDSPTKIAHTGEGEVLVSQTSPNQEGEIRTVMSFPTQDELKLDNTFIDEVRLVLPQAKYKSDT